MPGVRPASSSIERNIYDVVVLPLVPVMPTKASSRSGRPYTIGETTAMAQRILVTKMEGTASAPATVASAGARVASAR